MEESSPPDNKVAIGVSDTVCLIIESVSNSFTFSFRIVRLDSTAGSGW